MSKEQTFKSPGFFDREIDATATKPLGPVGTPYGVVGTAERGPAFVPITVGDMSQYRDIFGGLDSKRFGPYAVDRIFKAKSSGRGAVTFMRVLGAGANVSVADFNRTKTAGVVSNAGFKVTGDAVDYAGPHAAAVQFIVARHSASMGSDHVDGQFSDNNTFPNNKTDDGDLVGGRFGTNLVRGVVFLATGTRLMVTSSATPLSAAFFAGSDQGTWTAGDGAKGENPFIGGATTKDGLFTLILSASDDGSSNAAAGSAGGGGVTFGGASDAKWKTNGIEGIRAFTASLDPGSDNYFGKILNTNPSRFAAEQHLLYLDYEVSSVLMSSSYDGSGQDEGPVRANRQANVAVLSGSANTDATSALVGVTYLEAFGRFDTRYRPAVTTYFISQPFGSKEHDLFYFESLDDGAYANERIKVSITNHKASVDPKYPYGTFTVMIRDFNDLDGNESVLEQFSGINLDPDSDRYISRVIGDMKTKYYFDAANEADRGFKRTGRYPNVSRYIRVIESDSLKVGKLPKTVLPFGFRGIPALKTVPGTVCSKMGYRAGEMRFGALMGNDPESHAAGARGGITRSMTGSVIPPLPFRTHLAAGPLTSSIADTLQFKFKGDWGPLARLNANLYWGVKTEHPPMSASISTTDNTFIKNAILYPNEGSTKNKLVNAYTRFQGLMELGVLYSGSSRDEFNNNKFTLARVCLANDNIADLTASARIHMKSAWYARNGNNDTNTYKVTPGGSLPQESSRITLASLLNSASAPTFNRFSDFTKFTNIFYGGFDGLNILNKDATSMGDKAASTDAGGHANASYSNNSLLSNVEGTKTTNNAINSYRQAVRIMTEKSFVTINVLAVPGIRDDLVTDEAMDLVKKYALAMYILDGRSYDKNSKRLFMSDKSRPDTVKTVDKFEERNIDNNYAATYYPDVIIPDTDNNRNVKAPSSIAALAALSYNDDNGFPWFAPAGFNRASLDFVVNVTTRLNSRDRDDLYEARLNPIATFPRQGFVIFGQKTLQEAKSSLDRVNVRRLLIEVKRRVSSIARNFLFEPNTQLTRQRLSNRIIAQLAIIQANAGVEQFRVIIDSTNNTTEDMNNYRLNGRIVIVPTRTVEFIAVDFILTNDGVNFV